jgi:hypothetical protein
MEILAIGSLAYLGSVLNNNLTNNTDIINKKKVKPSKKGESKEKFTYFNRKDYQHRELEGIQKNYKKRVAEIKNLSYISNKTRVIPSFSNQLEYKSDTFSNKKRKQKVKKHDIPNAYDHDNDEATLAQDDAGTIDIPEVTSFYNQKPSVGDQYRDEKLKIPGRLKNGVVKDELNILDSQFNFGEIDRKSKEELSSNGHSDISQGWSSFKEKGDMTYGIFKSSELQHNNMQPFNRKRDEAVEFSQGKMTDEINSANNMTKMELFTGSSKNYWPKEAPPAFFEPMKDVHFVNGMPNMSEKLVERFIPGNQRAGEKPFQPIQVQPGLALGYLEESKIGYHDTYRAPQPTIDFQRVGNRMQKSNPGVVIPGMKGQKQPVDPNVAKRRPEKVWEIDDYVHGGGNGGVSKPAVNPDQIAKDQMRAFSMELKNGLGIANGSMVGPSNREGDVREPHKLTLEEFQTAGPQLQSVNNNNLPSYYLLENQRTETGYNYYDAPGKGEIGKVHLFNTQSANPNMRQMTAETAQENPAYGDARKVHQFNTQAANANLRQETAETAQDGPSYGGIRQSNVFNTQAANPNLRSYTEETIQDGPSFGGVRKTNVYNLQPTNPNLRTYTEETINDGPSFGGVRKSNLYNTQPANPNLRTYTEETIQDGPSFGGVRKNHLYNTQPANPNLRTYTEETIQDGNTYSNVRKNHLYNTQPANPNLRTYTEETIQDGPSFGSVRKNHLYNTQPTNPNLRTYTEETIQDGNAYGGVRKTNVYNLQPANPNLRTYTEETIQDGPSFGSVRKNHMFNTQPANSNMRQTTADTPQDGPSFGAIRKTNVFNTQAANSNMRQTTADTAQDGPAHGDIRQVHQFNTQPTNANMRQTTADTAQDGPAYGDVRQVHQFNTQPTNANMRQTTAETAQDGPAHGDVKQVHQFNTQPANANMRQTTAETAQDGVAYGDVKYVHQYNTQPANANMRQITTDTPQDGPARASIPKVHQFNKQPANSTTRQIVNYDGYTGGTHVKVENLRSRSDANAMTTHSSREDTTKSRLMTYSGWHEGISKNTHGAQNSKERDVNNNWTRVNPPSSGPRSNSLQDMKEFTNLDERLIFQLNKIKSFPSMGDRIQKNVAEMLQNNELINNAYQKYISPEERIRSANRK